jgi:DNA-binding transcriptional regulator LsrR (DeoR family)
LHAVAKLHYESDLSQVEIAKRLGVSTATISRMLQRARADGIVRIEIRDLASPEELTAELRDLLGLKRAAVMEAPGAGALAALAAPLGEMLVEAGLRDGSVLAIGWGRAVRAVVEAAAFPPIPGVLVVPAAGGMQQHAPHFQINEFVRLAADQLGGEAHFIHAPVLPAAATRDAFLSDQTIADSVALWDRIDIAVVGVGLPHSASSPDVNSVTASERMLTAAGDVVRHYFDGEGRSIDWDGEDRMIALTADRLRHVPLSIGVAAGEEKAAAIVGAAHAGLISGLVTDTRTAEAVIARIKANAKKLSAR